MSESATTIALPLFLSTIAEKTFFLFDDLKFDIRTWGAGKYLKVFLCSRFELFDDVISGVIVVSFDSCSIDPL